MPIDMELFHKETRETEEWKNFVQRFDMEDPGNRRAWTFLMWSRLPSTSSVEGRRELLSAVLKADGIVMIPVSPSSVSTVQYEFVERRKRSISV